MPQGRDSLSLMFDIKLGSATQQALIHARCSLLERGEMLLGVGGL
jgi:hypothetical protein